MSHFKGMTAVPRLVSRVPVSIAAVATSSALRASFRDHLSLASSTAPVRSFSDTAAAAAPTEAKAAPKKAKKFRFPTRETDPLTGWFEKDPVPKEPTAADQERLAADRAAALDDTPLISAFSASLISLAKEDSLTGLSGSASAHKAEAVQRDALAALQVAPDWDVPDADASSSTAVATKASSAIVSATSSGLAPIPGIPTDVQLLRERAARGELLTRTEVNRMIPFVPVSEVPLPKDLIESGAFGDLSREDIASAETAAREVARATLFDVTARQPYDTVSMVIKARMKDLPLEREAFFRSMSAGTRPSAWVFNKYLKLQSVHGSPGRALEALVEMKRRGLPVSMQTYTLVISACARAPGTTTKGSMSLEQTLAAEQENELMIKYMSLNPPDITAAVRYPSPPEESEKMSSLVPLPPSTVPPRGAPADFVSVAPQFAVYGTKSTRGSFVPAVELAFYLFEEARAAGIVPDRMMYTSLISACGQHRQLERAFAVFELFRQHGAGGALVIKPAPIMDKHGGNDGDAGSVNALVDRTYVPSRRHNDDEALEARKAKAHGFEVDRIMIMKMMDACWRAHQYELAEDFMHDIWMNDGVQPDAPMYNLMIRIAADTAQVEKAFMYFEQMQHFGFSPSLITYTALIHACVQPNRPEFYAKAFEVFRECAHQGFHPTAQTYGTLLHACAEQADLNNGLLVWRSLSTHHPHLRDSAMFETMMRLIRRTMYSKKLKGLGGSCTVTGSASLYALPPDEMEKQQALGLANAKGTFELSRENRIRMAEALYAELLLLSSGAEHAGDGKTPAPAVRLRQRFLDELVGVYAYAMVGITMYERSEEVEGRGDADMPVTVSMIEEMVERAWERVKKLRLDHPTKFTLNEFGYSHMLAMYGASQRMTQMFYHFNHMVQDLKITPTYATFNVLIHWSRENRNVDAGLRTIREMIRFGKPPSLQDRKFFERMDKVVDTKIAAPSFPAAFKDENDFSERFNNRPRARRDGSKPLHPHDYQDSYKDW